MDLVYALHLGKFIYYKFIYNNLSIIFYTDIKYSSLIFFCVFVNVS